MLPIIILSIGYIVLAIVCWLMEIEMRYLRKARQDSGELCQSNDIKLQEQCNELRKEIKQLKEDYELTRQAIINSSLKLSDHEKTLIKIINGQIGKKEPAVWVRADSIKKKKK